MTQASILTITSNGTRTSPVKRGTWIMKTLLGADPGLPVANAGEIAARVPGIEKATVRKRLGVYHEQTEPLVAYYSKWAGSGDVEAPKHHRIDGLGKVEEVRDRIFHALG